MMKHRHSSRGGKRFEFIRGRRGRTVEKFGAGSALRTQGSPALISRDEILEDNRVGGFVPVVMAPAIAAPEGSGREGWLEIVSTNGRRVIVGGAVDINMLLRVVSGLEQL